ncbi:uncharacterized protein LOC111634575 [Centruroides sculpturatus]|uniref:uncharacterized protein LOC111634575 n=1 Tax=Centruroides sculpturatus TaxID=218467 RepID=UPI000C6C91C6|nr:uncharacterized protein LOC111634575 [Centruroides sculpturatus]
MKSAYEGEEELQDQLELPVLCYLVGVFVLLLLVSNMPTMLMFPTIRKYNGSTFEATICSIYFSFLYLQFVGQICSVLLLLSIISTIAAKRLIKLSEELEQITTTSSSLKHVLQEICEKHTEIWEMFEMNNKQWVYLFALIYAHFTYETCFLCFASLFFDVSFQIRVVFSAISMVFLTGSLSVSLGLSYLTSLIYDNFVSIQRFSSNFLSVEFKYKITCFMKRYGKAKMGVSVGDFFYIRKNFLIRMVSALYSIFSSVVQVTGVMNKHKSCNTVTTSNNVTFDNSKFNFE